MRFAVIQGRGPWLDIGLKHKVQKLGLGLVKRWGFIAWFKRWRTCATPLWTLASVLHKCLGMMNVSLLTQRLSVSGDQLVFVQYAGEQKYRSRSDDALNCRQFAGIKFPRHHDLRTSKVVVETVLGDVCYWCLGVVELNISEQRSRDLVVKFLEVVGKKILHKWLFS